MFHVEMKWGGKLLGVTEEKFLNLQSYMGFWGAILACETKKKKYTFNWLWRKSLWISYCMGNHSNPNIPQELQELRSAGNLFVSGSTHLVLGIEC